MSLSFFVLLYHGFINSSYQHSQAQCRRKDKRVMKYLLEEQVGRTEELNNDA